MQRASVPFVLDDVVVGPNTPGLPDAVEGTHPEHIVDKIEQAEDSEEAYMSALNDTSSSSPAGVVGQTWG